MHFYSIKEKGSRRYHLHIGDRRMLGVEIGWPAPFAGFDLSFGHSDGHDGVAVSISLVVFVSIYVDGVMKSLDCQRDTGIRFHDGFITVEVLRDWTGWRRGGFSWSWNYVDAIFGRTQRTSETLSFWDVVVPMPEGGYRAEVELTRETWRRPRWPFSKANNSANVKFAAPVPIEGKGESEWDCGEDAIYEMGVRASSVSEAVGATVSSIFERRLRHGTPSRINAHMPTQRSMHADSGPFVR